MKDYYVCYGIYQDGQTNAEYRCDFREQCQYYPQNPRWLAENYHLTETFGDGTVGEIKPPPMSPPTNPKAKYIGPRPCECPFFTPRPKTLKRKTFSTPFD